MSVVCLCGYEAKQNVEETYYRCEKKKCGFVVQKDDVQFDLLVNIVRMYRYWPLCVTAPTCECNAQCELIVEEISYLG